jgi:hypothetical protein
MPIPQTRAQLAAAGFVLGLVLWVCGVESVFGESGVLSPLVLLCGAMMIFVSAFLVLASRVDRELPDSGPSAQGVLFFSMAFGIGLGALTLALSRAFPLFVCVVFLTIGAALIAWSPQALRRFRITR